MKPVRSKLASGLLYASFVTLTGHAGCGSDDEAPGAAGAAGTEDASSGNGGTSGAESGGNAGRGGSAGASGAAGGGGTAGAAGSAARGGAAGSAGTGSGGSAALDSGADAAGDAGACRVCDVYGSPTSAGTIANTQLVELSGIVASRKQPGVFFAHNDSGDSARFFAFDQAGRTLGEFRLQGVSAADWEDMALGPCPAGSCLFFGDIGDNSEQRTSVAVVRVSEPPVVLGTNAGTVDVAHDRFEYRYAPGPQNAEALLADPKSGNLYVVTKNTSGTSLIFRIEAPGSPGPVQTLQTLRDLPLPTPGGRLVTGGAIHPCGDRLLLRTYDALFEYIAPPNQPLESAFGTTPRRVPVANEGQGEAVTYLGDGLGYVTASEGTASVLNLTRCP